MVVYKKIPLEIQKKYNLWYSHRAPFLERYKRDAEYFYKDVENTGTRFTQTQLEKIKDTLNIPLSINYIYFLIEQELAILMQAKPSFKIVSLDERGKPYAYILDKAVKSIMYYSSALGEEEESIKNMLIGGMGITGIIRKPTYQVGKFNLEFINIDLESIILDPNARRRDLQDLQGYFIDKEITKNEAKMLFQPIIDEINSRKLADTEITIDNIGFNLSSNAVLPAKEGNDTIQLKEYHEYINTNMYYYQDPITKEILKIFKENLTEEQFALAKPYIIDYEVNNFVKTSIMLNDYVIQEVVKPITSFPIAVKYFEWGGSTYKCYGVVHQIRDMQNAYDHLLHLYVINGQLTNSAGYLSPSTSIIDKDNWERIGNKPGIIKEYNPYIQGTTVLRPEKEQVQQLSSFYPQMLEIIKTAMESSTSINPIVQGNPQTAKVDVFSTAQQYQNAAMTRIQLMMTHINLANEKLGNVLVEYLLSELRKDNIYVFYSDTEDFTEIKLTEEMMQIKMLKYLLLSIPSEATPTQKAALVTELMNIAQTTTDPNRRDIYMQQAFKYAGLRGFDELEKKINTITNLQNQLQSYSEEIKRLRELNKQFENRAERSETTAKVVEKTYQELIPLMMEAAKIDKEIETKKIENKLKTKEKDLENKQ